MSATRHAHRPGSRTKFLRGNPANLWPRTLVTVAPTRRRAERPPNRYRPPRVETRILEAFALFGWLSDPELVEVVDGYGPTTKTARSRLTKSGVLVDTGTTRLSPRGSACTVWKRAEEAQ